MSNGRRHFAVTDRARLAVARANSIGPWVDARGHYVLAMCDYAHATVNGRPTARCEGCARSQCVCLEGTECDVGNELVGPFRLATREEADGYWNNIAAGVEDPRTS